MNIFKTMACSIKGEQPSDSEINEIPSFIFCKWLSGSPYFLQCANAINRFNDIPIDNQFYLVQNFNKYILKGKVKYIPYPKGVSEEQIKDVEYISRYYKCSLDRAKEYLEYISEKELNRLRVAYAESK